jgi:hypothetical protein
MEQPIGAAETEAAHAVCALPDLMALVFERLPAVEQCVTVGRLSKAWRRWAAPRCEALRAAEWHKQHWERLQVPQWCLAEAWPRIRAPQRASCAGRAAACGDVERLRWLRAQDPPCYLANGLCEWAARNGHPNVVQWLRANDPPCRWGTRTCAAAANAGHLDVLQWLRAQDPPCPWGESACSAAAAGDRLDVLRWLRAQDPPCPWGKHACTAAARHGHLDVLRWLRAQDPPCPWDEDRCRRAATDPAVCAWIDEQPDAV